MHCLGFVVLLLVFIGVFAGVTSILDALGVIDLDTPEYPYSDYWKGDSKKDDEIRMEGHEK